MARRLAAFALLIAGGIVAPVSAHAQKALVYCPSADASGCAAIGTALSAHGSFPGGTDRAFDGSGGTVDLASVDLSAYAVFVVPSLATDGGTDPYAVLRSEAVASRLRAAFTGRVAVWSGTPDLGTSNLDKKQALIRNLTRWAAADAAAGRAGGIVALQDASPEAIARYGWLAQVSSVSVASDAAVTEVFANVEARTAAGREMLDWNGLQLGYTNMASSALIAPAGASVEATGGRTTAAVLVTFAGAAGGTPIATVTTDKEDYAPGETVTITGTGWLAGETVSMKLHEEPLVHGDRTLTAVADGDGRILNNSFRPEPHDLGVRFVLDAVGLTSGKTAQTTFTDDVGLQSVAVGAQSPASVTPGQTATYVITVGFNGNNSTCTVGLSVTTALPTGAVATFTPATVTASTNANQLSTLTISTTPSTPAGTFSFTVGATETSSTCAGSDNTVRTATGSLVVAAAPAPTVDAGGPYAGNEGSSVSLAGATASGGAAPLTYKWTYVPGTGVDAGTSCSFSPNDASLNPSVTCTDDGTFTLTLTATGSNGQSASDNATLTLANVAPTANAGGPYSGAEGSLISLSGTGDDAGNNDDAGLTYLWSVTATGIDAGGTCTIASPTSQNTTVTCTDNGNFSVSLTASDGDGGTSSASTANLTVANAPPGSNAGAGYSGAEGAPVQLNGSGTDAGSNDVLTYLWTASAAGLGGGTCSFDDPTKKDAKVTCTDNGSATLTLTVTDDDGGTDADEATLTLSNVAPVANAGGDYTGNEGSAVQLNGSATDAGSSDTRTWSWQYVNGPAVDAGATCSFSSATAEDPTVTCTDDGVVELTLTVTDDDGGSTSDKANLTLSNVAPTADARGPYSGNEGAAIQLAGGGDDAGNNDDLVLTYKWTADVTGISAGGACTFDDDTKKDAKVTCTDNGTFTLTLTVKDDDGGEDTDTAILTIANIAPVANAGQDYTGNEGSAIQLNGSVTDVGANDTHTWSWEYVEGTGFDVGGTCAFDNASAEDPKVTCTDDGTVELTLTVTDDDGASGVDKANLTLSNVAPVALAGGPYAGNEGSAVALNGSATDAGANDVISYLWTANVSSLDAGASCSFSNATQANSTVTCTDNGMVTLTLKATDDDGAFTTSNATLTVANVDPVADAGTAYTGAEGSAVALDGTVTDAGANDTHTWSWQYVAGPGALDAGASCSFDDATKQDPKITCTDDGVVQLTLTVTDDDGGQGTDTATLTVTNAPPVAVAGGPYSGTEGSAVSLAGSATDPGTNDQLAYLWSVATPGIDAGGSCAFDDATKKDAKVTCTDDGTFTLTLKATDDDGGEDTESATLTIANADPVANAGGPYSGVEGATVALSGTESDAGSNDVLSRLWTYSGGGGTCTITNPTSLNASIACTDNGTYQLTLTVTDDDLASHASNASFTVSNAAPILSAINAPLAPVNINTAVTVSANFTDEGAADTHTGLINWGDGTATAAAIAEANGSGTASGTHAYASPGVYTVRMTVTDDDGAVSNESVYQYIVVFDPSAGFVTGGGWLNSTPGMYRVDAAAQGKANFGFVSKYQKGATVPTGNTEFQFHAGDLNFKSSVYQWLVVQGQTKASYKGSGTINGSGDYGFLLSVIDGGSSGDKFRIKIWNKSANDVVVYDNLLADAGDDALPTTGIVGGNIVVHAK